MDLQTFWENLVTLTDLDNVPLKFLMHVNLYTLYG